MNTKSFNTGWRARSFTQRQCFAVLVILLLPVIYTIIQSESGIRIFFHAQLFFAGFFVFTFFEYIAHRFWMHGKEEKHPGKKVGVHMHHHRHPGELKITSGIRNCLLLTNVLLAGLACWFNNYSTLFVGFYTGFVFYSFMHVFLHKTWAKKVCPSLLVWHIHHHCKYPDRCFGISLTWWDRLFNTAVSGKVKISDKVLEFYFGKQVH